MMNIDQIMNNIEQKINDCGFDLESIKKIDKCIKTTEASLNGRFIFVPKSIKFNESDEDLSKILKKSSVIPHEEFTPNKYDKSWDVDFAYCILEYKRGSDGKYKFFYSKVREDISLGLYEYNFSYEHIVTNREFLVSETILSGAKTEIKIEAISSLEDLISLIIDDVSEIPF